VHPSLSESVQVKIICTYSHTLKPQSSGICYFLSLTDPDQYGSGSESGSSTIVTSE
jgi:hypothetical protein